MTRHGSVLSLVIAVVLAIAPAHTGCRRTRVGTAQETPSIATDLAVAFDHADADLRLAIDHSLAWFDRPSSRRFFPVGDPPVTHDRARASLAAFRDLLDIAPNADAFAAAVLDTFDVHESPGRDDAGTVLFTAYFAPEYRASRRRSPRYAHPLYRLPPELADASPGDDDSSPPWRTRREIEDGALLAGREIAWLEDALDAYLVHVNGSARLRLDDGGVMHVGYSGTNRRPYTSLGRLLIDEGLVAPEAMSMQAIQRAYERDPTTITRLMRENDRYVFFREDEPAAWPLASTGVPLTPRCSMAIDPGVHPPGALALVTTTLAERGETRPFVRFVLAQDSGGAIEGPGRVDLYLGVGDEAGAVAGRQIATGGLAFLLLRPEADSP